MSVCERTLVLVKPDGLQRGKVGAVIQRFEAKGLQLVALKLVHASEQRFRDHYADIVTKPYYSDQVRYMSSCPVVAMVWQGSGAAAVTRSLIGHVKGPAGNLRCDNSLQAMKNVVHGSDGPTAAQREITLWFTEDELMPWTQPHED